MKLSISALLTALFLSSAGLTIGQMTTAKLKELNSKARWVLVTRDADSVPYYVDHSMMDRIRDTVVFRVKTERRGTSKFMVFLGGCDDNRVMMTSHFAVYPGSEEPVLLEKEKSIYSTSNDSIGSSLLDYVCKNAKITLIEDSTVTDVVWQRYKNSEWSVSSQFPKMPTVIKRLDECDESQTTSFYAYAAAVVYELTVTSKRKGTTFDDCDKVLRFTRDTMLLRQAEIRTTPKIVETSGLWEGRRIVKFNGDGVTRWIISDMQNSRWIELAVHSRSNSFADKERFLSSLKLANLDGKEIGDGTLETLGDAGYYPAADSARLTKTITEPVRVIANPKAAYTTEAKNLSTQGSVQLKVTFLASGNIGKIDVVKSLPNGLREQAIAAAKKIVFLPKTSNGELVDSVRVIEYTFEIY